MRIDYIQHIAKTTAPDLYQAEEAENWAFRIKRVVQSEAFTEASLEYWSPPAADRSSIILSKAYVDLTVLAHAADQYKREFEWLSCEDIDWLLASALCYGELKGACHALTPIELQAKTGFGMFSIAALKFIAWLALWAAWIAIAFVLYKDEKTLFFIFFAVTCLYQWGAFKRREKRKQLLELMIEAYRQLVPKRPSWSEALRSLQASKAAGAVWPASLYRIVEDRARINGAASHV